VVRIAHAAVVLALGAACGSGAGPAVPQLPGTWIFDEARVSELYEVVAAPEGPERERALARARSQHAEFEIVFTDDEATLMTGTARRSVPYRVRAWHGLVVQLEALHGETVVTTIVKVDEDRMTWFDRDGEVEFVLRRAQ
jgi:hypothetical protein